MPDVKVVRTKLDDGTYIVTTQGRSRGRATIEHFVESLLAGARKTYTLNKTYRIERKKDDEHA